jgi:CRP/FNR family transcriptional regulator, cyclic AMP receptor protein
MNPFEMEPITTKLGEIPWLRDVSAEERELIERHTTSLAAPASKMLCGEGQPGLDAFIIVTGDAAVIADGRQIAQLTTGDFCGEMALIQGTVRSAHVVALTPMHLLSMSKAEFDLLLRDSPAVNHQVLQSMAHRLDDANHSTRRP